MAATMTDNMFNLEIHPKLVMLHFSILNGGAITGKVFKLLVIVAIKDSYQDCQKHVQIG